VTPGSRALTPGGRSRSSVRGRPSRPAVGVGIGLLLIIVAAVLLLGGRGFFPAFPRGDLLYHWALTHEILRGDLPPGGPYPGLPAYYPPGFHLLLAGVTALTGWAVETTTLLLGFAWLPVLPVTTFALARRLTGRSDVALVAAALTVFGGGFDFSPDRLWVNSLFLVGHEAYPLYPRDLVFGLLPLAVLAFLRAIDDERRGWAWAILAGAVLGACAVIQVQLLLPIPLALAVTAAVAARTDRSRLRPAVVALVITGGLAFALVLPWLLPTIAEIRRNGGVALDSAEALLPARIGLWRMPREFGLLLPLGVAGLGVVLVHLRLRDRELTGIRPPRPWDPVVLVPWFVLPWLLAILYDPNWPLEDALRPQRLWLLASQPGAILAAVGTFALAKHVTQTRLRRPRWMVPAVVGAVLLATVPTTAFTVRLLTQTWLDARYAALELDRDRVPDMSAVLGVGGPITTVLTYEDWSSLVWYETGSSVVAVKPPGYAKLAFDPEVFTSRSQEVRRRDIARAFDGDEADLRAVADDYRAQRILVARRGDRWGLIHQVAAIAALDPARVEGRTKPVDGNGWDAETLEPGARLIAVPARGGGPVLLEIRVAGTLNEHGLPLRHFRLAAVNGTGIRDLGELTAPATTDDDWQVVTANVDLLPGEAIAIRAVDPITVQSVVGFTPGLAPPGWRVAVETADAVVLERTP
jgi:hypothetical protein